MLLILLAVYAGSLIGVAAGKFDLAEGIGLRPMDFWRGRFWTFAVFWLLPAGVADLLFNGVMVVVLGGRLERAWSKFEFWTLFLIGVIGSGAAKVLLTPAGVMPLLGITGGVWGLIVGWFQLFGREEVQVFGIWSMTVRTIILLTVGAAVIGTVLTGGSIGDFLPALGGAVAAWVYLAVRWRHNREMEARMIQSRRVSKLEL